MKSFPNQKKVITQKQTPSKASGKQYLAVYTETLQNAAKDLTFSAFKVYLWFLSNRNDYEDVFSPALISEAWGGDRDTLRDSFKVLVDKGYLTLKEGTKATYIFTDKPITALPSALGEALKKKSFRIDGEQVLLTYKELLAYCDGDEAMAKEYWRD